MPQASKELQDKFPGSDRQALDVIDSNYAISKGFIIYPRVTGYEATDRECDAINYLADEWDYGYMLINPTP